MLEPINVFSHIHLAGWGWVSHNVEPRESWVAWVQGRERSCQPSSVCDPESRSGPPDHVGPSLSSVSQSSPAGFGGAGWSLAQLPRNRDFASNIPHPALASVPLAH